MTAVSLIVPPAAAPISLDEAKLFARVENDAEDELIETLIDAATEHVEKCTGRQLVVATYDLYRDTFPDGCCSGHPQGCAAIQLPISPLVDVVGVFYISPDTGLEIEVAADQYRVDMISQPGWIAPGERLAGADADHQPVRVRFRAGYTTVPARQRWLSRRSWRMVRDRPPLTCLSDTVPRSR